jgi:hypothetical protein
MGLADVTDEEATGPICIGMYAPPGAGKSRFIGTAKGKIGVLALESKTKKSVTASAREFGRRVVMPKIKGEEVNLIRVANPVLFSSIPKTCIVVGDSAHVGWSAGKIQDEMQRIADTITIDGDPPYCCQRHYSRWSVNRVKYFGYMMLEDPDINTICIDPFGSFVEDVSYANYGLSGVIDPKEFGFAPREDFLKEIREFLNVITQKHTILTHHAKPQWVDNKPTSKWELDGKFSKIGHYVNVMVELKQDKKKAIGEGRYSLVVNDCQDNIGLISKDPILFDEDITFTNLAVQVREGTEPEEWE